ncbi:MAG: hypothetical protein ACLFVY_08295 [Phycisphaerae bacterium]
MRTRTVLALLVVAGISAIASGQTDDSGKTWTGVVTGDDVYVRSSPKVTPGTRCVQLDQGAKVTVVRTIGGGLSRKWYEIQPVEDTFSAVSKQYVKLANNGKSGTITGNNVNIRGGGKLSRRGQFNYVHRVRLNKGDTVTVIGQSGQYYAIEPPKGATFFVSADHVVPKADYTAPEKTDEAKDDSDVTTPDGDDDTPTDANGTDVVKTDEPADANGTDVVKTDEPADEVAAVVKAWKDAEQALQAEYKKPYAKRDLKAVLAKYKAIELSKDSYLKPYVKARVTFLETQMKQADELEKIDQMVKKSLAEQERLRMLRSKLQGTVPTTDPVTEYAVTGILKASHLFSGGATGGKRYMVLDPKGIRIKAYVEGIADLVDLSKYEGKHVGIYGPKKFDKKLSGLYIVKAEAVKVLDEKTDLPDSPRSRVKAPPKKTKTPATKEADQASPKDPDEDSKSTTDRPDFSGQETEMDKAEEAAEETDVEDPEAIEDEDVSISDLPETGLPVADSSSASPDPEDAGQE